MPLRKPSAALFSALALVVASAPAPLLAEQSGSSANSANTEGFDFGVDMPEAVFAEGRTREMLAVQILLDRTGHSPGVIDGYGGGNTSRALAEFEKAHGLDADGKADDKAIGKLTKEVGSQALLQNYTISESDVAGPFEPMPAGMKEMSKKDRIGYTSASEKLAEKFHMDEGLLEALNPDADFAKAGQTIIVAATGSDEISATVARIEVDKGKDEVRAYDGSDNLVASFPATVGSSEFPSPSGTMQVAAIAIDASYTFDPGDQEWGGDEALSVPPGPNNPIGGIWIDLGKNGYGIHGTTDPASIAKTASHGCVRLTNWDARALARAVSPGSTNVVFQ